MIDIIKIILLCFAIGAVCVITTCCFYKKSKNSPVLMPVHSASQAVALLPKTPQEIIDRTAWALEHAEQELINLIALKNSERTFSNTAQAFDTLTSHFAADTHIISGLIYVHPEKSMRETAQQEIIKLQNFAVDHFENNEKLYQVFKEYVSTRAPHESLTAQQRYFLQETMDDFRRAGLELPPEKRNQLAALKKELAALGIQFQTNIDTDNRTITASRDELAGLDEDCIAQFSCDEHGNYSVPLSYPIFTIVMKHATNSETRKRMSRAFNNRAYPVNVKILDTIIAQRDRLARMLGYESYTAFDLEKTMAGTEQRALDFLNQLLEIARKKQAQEFQLLSDALPDGIQLNEKKQFYPWDVAYVKERYKQKHLNLDDRIVAHYFPMEHTIEQLLAIYQEFLGVQFTSVSAHGAWHQDVRLLQVNDKKTGQLYGFLFLDLYPRANKYSHAAHLDFIVTTKTATGAIQTPNAALIMANFPQSTATKPSLLKHSDVTTFFHEFGHAMHALVGATELASFAGTAVKTDFVELPSQMFEEWMYEPIILRRVTCHYLTGKPMPEEMIDTIKELKKFDAGSFVTSQSIYSQLSLAYFAPGTQKDTTKLMHELYERNNPYVALDSENHMQASFGHLIGYGAKYYGYLWARVFAADLFEYIQQHGGLLDPSIGMDFRTKILSHGGSIKPDALLHDFLGREPNQLAFKKSLGLS